MKLEKAYQLATPRPLRHAEDHHGGGCIDNCSVSIFRSTSAARDVDAALLAHAYNMLPELVEALEAYVEADWQASGENAGVYGKHKLQELEKLLAKAKEVPGV